MELEMPLDFRLLQTQALAYDADTLVHVLVLPNARVRVQR